MRNITTETTRAKVRGRFPHQPEIPPRGVEGCICQQQAPRSEFIEIFGPGESPKPVWYARKTCEIHGITVTVSDPSESPATDTSTTPSTPAS